MKKIITLNCRCILLLLMATSAKAQDPAIIWQNTLGGSFYDYLVSTCYTPDGGCILGGYSQSPLSGDKTEGIIGGGEIIDDYWIVKLDAAGNISWQNTIGGNNIDILSALNCTPDGGYILGGYSSSPASGDKTENAISGSYDYWVVKLNASGNIVWQNTIGGSGDDFLTDIRQVADGGYIVAGNSKSGVSGDKTESNKGIDDYWIMKLNSTGSIVWQNTIGGNGTDIPYRIKQISDGNYIVCGGSSSVSGTDITDPTNGNQDYWILKLDASGNIIWQNMIGGTSSDAAKDMIEIAGGDFIITGQSFSSVSGDKTTSHGADDDDWIVQLSSSGSLMNQRVMGGTGFDQAATLMAVSGGYVFLTKSFSGKGFEKNENGDGATDYWLYKLDTDLNPVWQYMIGGNDYDSPKALDMTPAGDILIGGNSKSQISDDKTENCISIHDDYWVMKVALDNCIPVPLYSDLDSDAYGNPDDGIIYWDACEGTAITSIITGDCNDENNLIHPTAIEACDGVDNDCSGAIDNGLVSCNPGPAILFQNTIGGEEGDNVKDILATADGGYLIGGESNSDPSDDKTEYNYGPTYADDFWIVKTDAELNVLWDNTIGGTLVEELGEMIETPDGGYLLAGTSNSPANGDKTEAAVGPTLDDYWIVKINNLGVIQWQNVIGGPSHENLKSASLTADGGYILGGYSYSGIGGDRTEANMGGYDYWVVKTNASGAVEWQNAIGGAGNDYLYAAEQTLDGGYIIGGYSTSGISGDKTEGLMGASGVTDIWVLKLNAGGNIVWQNTIGGTGADNLNNLVQLEDGTYIIAGESKSPISGDKTEGVINLDGTADLWLLHLDATGNILAQKTIGGTGIDLMQAFQVTADGHYLVGASSTSPMSANKTEINFGEYDYWVMELDENFNIVWQNTIGGEKDDHLREIIQTGANDYVIAGSSYSSALYDKTESNFGYDDYWIIKLANDDCSEVEEVCNGLDDNCNGLTDDVSETISVSADGPTTVCQGTSILLSAIYSGATIQWKKNGVNIPGATASTYTATKSGNYSAVTNSACGSAISTTISVTVNKNPNASISASGPTTFCAGSSVTLTEVPVAGCFYQWYKGATAITGANTTTYIATTAGNYKCRVTKNATGCFKNSNVITVTVPCREEDTEQQLNEHSFYLYPNPASHQLLVTCGFAADQIRIVNAMGQLVYDSQLNAMSPLEISIDVKGFASGIYHIQVISKGIPYIQKFIKE